jgi:competence protein ComEA
VALAQSRLIGFNRLMKAANALLRKSLAVAISLAASAGQASVDANLATRAELDAITGIGPVLAERIVHERRRGPFLGFDDLRRRVKGVGESGIRRMREAGLRIGPPVETPAVEIIIGGVGRR